MPNPHTFTGDPNIPHKAIGASCKTSCLMVTRMGLIGIRMGLVLKDKPACLQTENASENNAKMQYAYMAYCAMRFISIE